MKKTHTVAVIKGCVSISVGCMLLSIQVHVLTFTVHQLLSILVPTLKSGDLDPCMIMLIDVRMFDIKNPLCLIIKTT